VKIQARWIVGAIAAAIFVWPSRGATTHVYLIGDSTMADKPTPDVNPERGWGQLLPRFFQKNVVVRNYAVNGRSTKSFIDEGRWTTVLSQLTAGDVVLIEFGHNDEKIEDSTRYAAPRTVYRRNLARFVSDARAKRAMPILITPIVRRKFDANGTLEDTHGEYPSVVREVATALDVPLVDLQAMTDSLVRRAGPLDSQKLYVWVAPGESSMYPEGRQDDTHLSVVGANEVAKLAARSLRLVAPSIGRFVIRVD
jgi:DNA sulfur modification protein DndE